MFVIVVNNTCFLKTVQKVRKGNGLGGKRELYKSFMMKGEKTPYFPQLFDLLEKDFQLTLIARLVASLWISHVHKAIASAPNWSIGCSAFFRLDLCHLMMLTELLACSCTPECS